MLSMMLYLGFKGLRLVILYIGKEGEVQIVGVVTNILFYFWFMCMKIWTQLMQEKLLMPFYNE
jgi:hypothetical protein